MAFLLEGGELPAFEHTATRQLHLHRVDVAAVDHDLVVQVRPGREAGRANIADDLTLPYLGTLGHVAGECGHVAIAGGIAVGGPDPDELAVASFPADVL